MRLPSAPSRGTDRADGYTDPVVRIEDLRQPVDALGAQTALWWGRQDWLRTNDLLAARRKELALLQQRSRRIPYVDPVDLPGPRPRVEVREARLVHRPEELHPRARAARERRHNGAILRGGGVVFSAHRE